MDVTFMTAEKWVVPDPIQYELLSLPQDADYEEFPFSGIHLDPLFVCLQTKLLCYHAMGNVNGMAKMLTLMNSFITENTFTASCGNESNSYWMGSGTTHFSAVIKVTSMYRTWKNMFVKLRNIHTGLCCVISQFPGKDFNLTKLENIAMISCMMFSISSVVFRSTLCWTTFIHMSSLHS
jgi:hypothetical protein